jgi:DNA-binding transcriptional LysR family regulator
LASHRTTRVTKLTIDGEAYFTACAAALDDIDAAEAALTSANQIISGRLRIEDQSFIQWEPELSANLRPRALPKYAAERPIATRLCRPRRHARASGRTFR